jgi:hypothetical protein
VAQVTHADGAKAEWKGKQTTVIVINAADLPRLQDVQDYDHEAHRPKQEVPQSKQVAS